jgi:multisubunit Na+/H+ antiporter MnhG subunit
VICRVTPQKTRGRRDRFSEKRKTKNGKRIKTKGRRESVGPSFVTRVRIMGKAQNYAKAIALQFAVFLLWFTLFLNFSDALPTWLIVTLAALMFATIVGPWLVFAIGPASLLARFPPTVRPLFQGQVFTLVIWSAGIALFLIVRGTLPERLAEMLLSVFLIGGCVPGFLSLFGYGRLGRRLTEAAKQEERESWRS